MKHISFILLLFFLVQSPLVNGQVRFALRAGVHSMDIQGEDLLVTNGDKVDELSVALKEAHYGFHAGIMVLAELGNFYLQPELLYNNGSTSYEIMEPDHPDDATTIRQKYQYLDIPVMAGLKLGPLRIGAGPVAHILLNTNTELSAWDGLKEEFNNLTIGYQAGIGLDIWRLHFDVRYEGNFSRFGDSITVNGNSYQFSNNPERVIGTIGFSF